MKSVSEKLINNLSVLAYEGLTLSREKVECDEINTCEAQLFVANDQLRVYYLFFNPRLIQQEHGKIQLFFF